MKSSSKVRMARLIKADEADRSFIFNECDVRYLVVGAYAVICHAEPIYTKDLDIWQNQSKKTPKMYGRDYRSSEHHLRVLQ
nr:hypothetical protein [Desulfobacterales bacterium]